MRFFIRNCANSLWSHYFTTPEGSVPISHWRGHLVTSNRPLRMEWSKSSLLKTFSATETVRLTCLHQFCKTSCDFSWEIVQIRFGHIISRHPKVLSLFLISGVISWSQTGHFVWSDQNLLRWKLFLQRKRSDWHIYPSLVKHHVIFHKKLLLYSLLLTVAVSGLLDRRVTEPYEYKR